MAFADAIPKLLDLYNAAYAMDNSELEDILEAVEATYIAQIAQSYANWKQPLHSYSVKLFLDRYTAQQFYDRYRFEKADVTHLAVAFGIPAPFVTSTRVRVEPIEA
jgi:hypothetical protein